MGHLGAAKSEVFRALAERLNSNPVGAPKSETLMKILHIMYSEQEAAIGSKFPPGFVTIDKLAQLTGLAPGDLESHLAAMAGKGLVMDIPRKGRVLYALSPLVIGFFEYTFMRVTDKLPLTELAELFERYHNERGVAEEFFGAETKLFQTWAFESTIREHLTTEVLDFEKASAMIRDAGKGSLTMCYCRHQALHRGTVCSAPIQDVCTSLGVAAEWLISKGFARPASADELLRVLEATEKLGLVHLADNVQNKPAFICHCCGCCCGALRSINEHGVAAVQPSNFLARIDTEK
ncbi:MAG: (Fe-S)-binding protein, partial [Negativicutes bacterium]|nr:(Fe-S)-binding protein [Negativicutes bacterium]